MSAGITCLCTMDVNIQRIKRNRCVRCSGNWFRLGVKIDTWGKRSSLLLFRLVPPLSNGHLSWNSVEARLFHFQFTNKKTCLWGLISKYSRLFTVSLLFDVCDGKTVPTPYPVKSPVLHWHPVLSWFLPCVHWSNRYMRK